jgi:hypothetical protein
MQKSYASGGTTRIGPESCGAARKGMGVITSGKSRMRQYRLCGSLEGL